MSNKKGPDEIYCRSCGEPIKKKAEICPNCGVANEYTDPSQGNNKTNQTTVNATSQSPQKSKSKRSTGNFTSGSTEHDPSNYTTETSDQWHYATGASVALWVIGFAFPEGSAVAGIFFLTAWVLMPVSIYYDREWLRATTKWDPKLTTWVILTIIPLVNIVAGVVYLFRRYNVSEVSSPNIGYGTGQENDRALSQLRERYSQGELSDEEFEQKAEQIIGTENKETAQIHLSTKEGIKNRE